MSNAAVNVTFPPGRMVWGSLYDPKTKDFEGRPLVYKTGADAGKPRNDYSFGVAIPKAGSAHWAETPWGKLIWQVGHTVSANAGQMGDNFAWKVVDGDSTVAGKRGRPCDKPGYAGHWIVAFSSSFAPRVVNGVSGKFEALDQPGYINPGDYVQVAGNVKGNNSQGNPGILINHNVVCFSGYGERIHVGVDASQLGFATGPVAGAQAAPVGVPSIPGSVAPTGAPPAPPAVVQPNPSFVPPVPAAPAAPARVMTEKANGQTYEAFIAAGWTDAQLVQHGMMQP